MADEGGRRRRLDPAELDETSLSDLSVEKAPLWETSVMGEWAASVVRVLLVVFVGLTYASIGRTPGDRPWLAAAVLVAAGTYGIYLLSAEPHRRYDLQVTKAAISAADLGLILAWLYATGGFPSDYHPLLYASTIALSFRYDLWRTLLGSAAHVAGYAALLFAMGHLSANLATVTVQSGFIILLGTLGSLLSMVATRETVAKEAFRGFVEDLERSISLHEATLDATRDGILVVDLDANIISYNDRFQRMWGIPDEVVETRDDEQALASVLDRLEDPKGFLDRVEELYANPEAESYDIIELKDGRIFERTSRPQRVGDEIVGRVWSFHDVTEERRTREELERSNEALRQFTSAVSHDLREPLRMITSYLELLDDRAGDRLAERERQHLHRAREGADRLERMIQGLSRYSRLERRGEPLGTVDLNDAVADARGNLRSVIEREDATIEVDELPEVRGDRSQLATLFQNLLANAIRHNDEGTPDVEIHAEPLRDRWKVFVADDGPGIPPEERDAIFEMFQQGKSAELSEGEGIGLAMCRKIVERHGGEIGVETTPGEGATFSFTLDPPPERDDRELPEDVR